ncbi:patatin [Bergeyella porcorum]|uniref:Patatin n=1 Tax=Bergeyella porcorum TaxID=1735111 RepID=A0AAU0F2E8_9FLAO
MKKYFAFLGFLILLLPFQSQVKEGFSVPPKPKIGLSLAGGGAKGFAHIGVLKVLDSLGVKVDYIAGTSMGAIVGGLYASGYTANEIEKIVLDTDFYSIITNEKTRQETSFFSKNIDKYLLTVPIKDGKINVLPKAISTGQKNIYMLKELFKNVSNIDDFSKLPIPFMCVATNLESGKMEIFEKGDLVSAIMASSAFPSLMDPVKIGDSLYIDGAMTVNYPSKPLKEKGIDIVIGVDLNQGLEKRENLTSLIAILNQVIDFNIQKETHRQYEFTDINVKPNLKGLSATSYGDKEKILKSGYEEAQKYVEVFSQLPQREHQALRAPINSVFSNVYKIDRFEVENNFIFGKNYIQGKMNLELPSLQTYGSINKMIDKLYATNNFTLINYDIVRQEEGNLLKLNVTEDESRFFLKFGLHYDEIFKTGLLLNATIKRLFFRNSIISLDLIVGDKPRYYFNYFIDNGYIPGFGVYASGMSFDLLNRSGEVKENWIWLRNEAFIQSTWRDRYAIGAGISHDYFKSKSQTIDTPSSKNFINPYAFIKSDTQDDKNFPTRGVFLYAEGKLLDLLSNSDTQNSIQVKVETGINIPISNRITNRLRVSGGVTFGEGGESFLPISSCGILNKIYPISLDLQVIIWGKSEGETLQKLAICFRLDL